MLMSERNRSGNRVPSRVQNRPPHASRRAYLALIAGLKRRGRIIVALRRALIVADGRPIVVGDVLPRAFPKHRGRYLRWQRWSCQRALMQEAQVIGRSRYGKGRPNL
jgi:hypothetical protein